MKHSVGIRITLETARANLLDHVIRITLETARANLTDYISLAHRQRIAPTCPKQKGVLN